MLDSSPDAFVVVTCGEKGRQHLHRCQDVSYRPGVPAAAQIVDPTGVGDAFRGGFLTGLQPRPGSGDLWADGRAGCHLLPGTDAARRGIAYTRAEFVARYRQYFDDQGKLDVSEQSIGIDWL